MASPDTLPAPQIVQSIIAILLGLLGLLLGVISALGAAVLVSTLVGVDLMSPTTPMPVSGWHLWAQVVTGSAGGLSSVVTGLAALLAGIVLLATQKAWPMVWTAAACAIHIVVFDMLGGVLLASAAIADTLAASSQADPALWIGQGGGLCAGLTIAALRLGFWAWVFASCRRFALSRPKRDEPVLTFN